MFKNVLVLGAAVILGAACLGCGSSEGDGGSNDGGGDRVVSLVCQRSAGCDLLDESTEECAASATEGLSGLSMTARSTLDQRLNDCLESFDGCDLFEDCVEGAFDDLDSGVDEPDPPTDCGYTGGACVRSSDCCVNHVCVNFGDSTSCAIECTADSQCVTGCCAGLEGGGGACGASSFCGPPTSDPCGDCISACSGLPSCCTGLGCICQDECAVSGCTPPAEFCCGPYDCICTTNCPY